MNTKLLMWALALCAISNSLKAQGSWKRLSEDIRFSTTMSGTLSDGKFAPFWMTANRYGLATIENNSGYIRAGIERSILADSLRNWKIGYGLDLAGNVNHDAPFIVQQLYADFQYKRLQLSIGQKERPMELRNNRLSSGALTSGINARPIPQVRISLPDFWEIPRTGGWVAVKGHIAYGAFTDNKWQRDFVKDRQTDHYTANTLYHSKAGWLRLGNAEKFPLTFTGGFEMSAQFGGEAWNAMARDDDKSGYTGKYVKMPHNLKAFWHAFIPGGSDASDGDYKNIAGNQLGSWHLSTKFHGKGWSARVYMEHYFEDHSQLFFEYGWKDMLYGVEIELPKNPVVSTFVYEHLGTLDQTGGLYHDATPNLPYQISGLDNYYNHGTYTGWHHAGFAMGNPLLVSPIYNSDGQIRFLHNRVAAHHFGLSGQPLKELGYRLLFTHTRSLGSYEKPTTDPQYGNYTLLELTYSPSWLPILTITASGATNGGGLLGRSAGGMLTLNYSGWLSRHK